MRIFMGVILVIATLLVLTEPAITEDDILCGHYSEIQRYIDFLKITKENPVDYIISLFDKNDLVVVCERVHPEMTQYEFFYELAMDKRFSDRVGHIFLEIGSRNYHDRLNHYLEASNIPDSVSINELNEIYRDFYDRGIWENANLYLFLKKIHDVNRTLDASNRIHVYPSGKAFGYKGMTKELYKRHDATNRDSSIAAYIIDKFKKLKDSNSDAKALVIMNYRHAFNRHIERANGELVLNVGCYLFNAFPGKVANVMLNNVIARQVADTISFSTIQNGRWDAAFSALDNPPSGFNLAGSPFGVDYCDYLYFANHDLSYQDLFTGFIFYNPVGEHSLGFGIPALFGEGFEDMLKQRIEDLFEVDSVYSNQYIQFVKEYHEMTYNTMNRHFEINHSVSTIDQEIKYWLND